MDLSTYEDGSSREFQAWLQIQIDQSLAQDQQMPDTVLLLQEYQAEQRRQQEGRFPLNDFLLSLIFVCLSDLSEQQRERLNTFFANRGVNLMGYTLALLRDAYMELFIAPRSSLDNPNQGWTQGGGPRSFVVSEYGFLGDTGGHWAVDEEDNTEGFLEYYDDAFWTYDEPSFAWVVRRFNGRRISRKGGKGKGKG